VRSVKSSIVSPAAVLLAAAFLGLPLAAAPQPPPPADPEPAEADPSSPWYPDRPEAGSVEAIRSYTTAPEFLPASVAYVPDSATVPSPGKVLGHLVGAPDELSHTADIYRYYRRLAEASDRVRVETIGKTEEGREILLVAVSDAANLGNLERLRDITARLADPRRTPRAEVRALVEEGKAFYWLTGGLHSMETGSPEMLMELAFRLAVSAKPEIETIRRNTVVLITPVAEPDGRDRAVDWYYRHLKGQKLPYEELREFSSPPYWGHYAFHDNNRDEMQQALALTRALHEAFFAYHPQVMHDLHESVPLIYISTGHGPYTRAADPVTISEWTALGVHEVGALSAQGLPGAWTWGFWDGWWPGYLVSVATNHNSVGRFYETFGNGTAATLDRDLSETRIAGKLVSEAEWYRPWPPQKKLRWSLRNNTNYMEAGVLAALGYAALHREELLASFWTKGERAIERGKSEAPYAWVFPLEQRDPGRLAYLVNQLLAQRIEVHRLSAATTLGGKSWPAGSYVVRMDQPYRNAAVNFLEEQKFPADEPNPPYDDVAWTWPLLYGVAGSAVADKAVLAAPMAAVTAPVDPDGGVDKEAGEGAEGDLFLLRDTGQTALLRARVLLGAISVDAAEAEFKDGGVAYPAGSWIVQGARSAVEAAARETGLRFHATATLPDVKRHPLDLPRLGVYHTWTSTQDTGWVRYAFDRDKVPYTLLNDEDLKRGGLGDRFDAILVPEADGSFADLVHGIDPKYGPLPYTQTPEFPSHGIPDASPDITGGMGLEGLLNLQRFVRGGGLLIAIGSSGSLATEGGIVREAERVDLGRYNTMGSVLRARALQPTHPLVYGYEARPTVFRGNGPLFDVAKRDRGRVVLQFGTKLPDGDEEAPAKGEKDKIEVEDVPLSGETKTAEAAKPGGTTAKGGDKEDSRLVLSGYVKNQDAINGKPAILDLPAGQGRVILYGFNPLNRYLNVADFRLLYNAILNWNDLPR
jgi:hypothetical protein